MKSLLVHLATSCNHKSATIQQSVIIHCICIWHPINQPTTNLPFSEILYSNTKKKNTKIITQQCQITIIYRYSICRYTRIWPGPSGQRQMTKLPSAVLCSSVCYIRGYKVVTYSARGDALPCFYIYVFFLHALPSQIYIIFFFDAQTPNLKKHKSSFRLNIKIQVLPLDFLNCALLKDTKCPEN